MDRIRALAGRTRSYARLDTLCCALVPVRRPRLPFARNVSSFPAPSAVAASPPPFGTTSTQDTIFALSTAQGKAAIAIIRVTGKQAADVYAAVVGSPSRVPAPNRLHTATVIHPSTGEVLDKGMAVLFQGPASATGEDVLELHVHGGRASVQGILTALSSLPSSPAQLRVRPSGPGEFTRRAFLAGKLDLTAVEGLADLLNADTEAQRRQALLQASGALASLYDGWRADLVTACAHVEAVLDFAADQDGVEDSVIMGAVVPKVHSLLSAMRAHIASSARGELIRDGVRMTILGPPNAGKSSLLNALARRPAAIVSPIPGTTRDVVEVQLELGGLPVLVSDTAGLRDSPTDVVEAEGIRRAQQRANDAHVRLVMLDKDDVCTVNGHSIPVYAIPGHLQCYFLEMEREGEGNDRGHTPRPVTLLLLNKHDELEGGQGPVMAAASDGHTGGPSVPAHRISCLTGAGLPSLLSTLEQHIQRLAWAQEGPGQDKEAPVITRERHKQHVVECIRSLERFLHATNADSGIPPDMACEDLRVATRALAALTGRVDAEELLDIIFRDFCIGK